ncbi:hypothetical protein DFQ27_003509 [Actinomortierella ambigua]|uniref:Crinkler effector protein N-terminal domain-containing protein n=1 Tax=Actinomortierella ambigua TaxID=1343610 RepID=A0A9P6Q4H8_9FUNG|nr:hypothetical protein DFQ27_003509 [Actinomortierella ambigua]
MKTELITLVCLEIGASKEEAFSVKVRPNDTIDHLKRVIKAEISPWCDHVATNTLGLWKVSIPITSIDKHRPVIVDDIDQKTPSSPTHTISAEFTGEIPEDHVHIVFICPPKAALPTTHGCNNCQDDPGKFSSSGEHSLA